MTSIIRIIVTSFLLCGMFGTFVFISKLSASILGMQSHSSTSISIPALWNMESMYNFTPGLGSHLYRQEVYSRAFRHHSRHLHQVRKYRAPERLPKHHTPLRRVCYVTVPSEGWTYLPAEQIDGTLCTHILVGFSRVVNGTLMPQNDQDLVYFRDVANLKKKFSHLKVMLSVGGANKDIGLQEVLSSLVKLEEFAVNSAEYLKSMNFDGIDIDWEFPAWYSPFEERFLFIKFLQELHLVYKNPAYGLIISVAVAAPKAIIDRSYRVAEMAKYVDFVSVMGYDFHSFKWYLPLTGHNSPLYPRSDDWSMFATANLNWSAFYWIQLGMPKEKLVIGLPTYGQTFLLYNQNFHNVYAPAVGTSLGTGQVAYPIVCKFLADGGVREFDQESRVPYAYQNQNWISYDDEESLEEKAQWIRNNQFGGVMIFDLNCDDFSFKCGNITFPLVKSIIRGLQP